MRSALAALRCAYQWIVLFSVFRTVRVPGAVALSTLIDKVLIPAMGWRRAYHDHCTMDPRNGAMYGSKSCTSVDSAFRPTGMHGYVFVNDDHVRLGDLMGAVGERLHWTYDLGVRWEHTIEVVDVSSTLPPDEEPHVFKSGRCRRVPARRW